MRNDVIVGEGGLFGTVHQALTFAFNFSGSTLDRPLMNRLSDKYRPSGKGLAGNDGAAQAGMILRRLEELSPLNQAILFARFSAREEPCHCCGQPKMRDEWMAAVRVISDVAVAEALTGHLTVRALRDGLVARYFGRKVHLQDLAAKASVHRDTASHHNSLIVSWLRGTRGKVRKGEALAQGRVGEEQRALNAAETLLLDVSFRNAENMTQSLTV